MSEIGEDIKLIIARLAEMDRKLDGKSASPWLTTQEAATYLRCSPRQVEKLSANGLLPFRRLDPDSPRSPRLYHRKYLTAYLATGKNPTTHRLTIDERRLVEELV